MAIETPEDAEVGDSAERDEPSFPRCVACGQPITTVTITEPLEGVASPCGCRLSSSEVANEDRNGTDR